MTTRPVGPVGPAGVAAPAPLRSLASPASQALVVGAFLVAFAALAVRMDSALWFAAPAGALLLGVVLGLQLDLRRWFAPVPGLVVALATLVGLSVLWAIALGWLAVEVPYALVPLAALVAFGADWWWVERLRPATVASGAVLVLLLRGDVAATLPLALPWFAVAAAALWSLRRDALQAVPTPVPLGGSATPEPDPGAARTAVAVAASWLVAGVVVALVSLIPLWFDSPDTRGRLGAEPTFDSPGPGSGGGGSGGGSAGGGPSGDLDGDGFTDAIDGRDVDGDGIPDRDIDGDGVPDADLDGDGIPDIDADGDGVPDDTGSGSVPDPGEAGTVPDGTGDGSTDGRGAGGSGRGEAVLRLVGLVVVALLVAGLVALAVRAIARELARRRALAARPWAVRLAERLEHEGARRGRARRRDEPVTRYAAVLAVDVLPHERLADVGDALSAALFGARAPSEATGVWAAGIVDEAVEANPVPTWWDGLRDRLRRRAG
ncbi:MAG TPA: hypothetical protein VF228_25935 [Iamia sp.]